MPLWIDGTLYPDSVIPDALDSLAAKVDFLARLCGAWDFGLLPREETLAEICGPDWRQAVDECRLLTSATYHLLRRWHELPELPYLGDSVAAIREDPNLAFI
jgi:hypothetical protein